MSDVCDGEARANALASSSLEDGREETPTQGQADQERPRHQMKYEAMMMVRLIWLYTEPRDGEREMTGKMQIRPVSPEQSEKTKSWNQHNQRANSEVITLAYYKKGEPKSDQ